MATIIDQTYFTKAELKLPIDNIDTVQDYIDEHEPEILTKALGYSLYQDFITGLAVLPTPLAKWTNLRDGAEYTDSSGYLQKYDGIKKIIADYVYFKIIADKQSNPTDSGVKASEAENSINTSPRYKQKFAQTDMINRIAVMNDFINVTNSDTPDTYENYLPGTFEKMTIFNI